MSRILLESELIRNVGAITHKEHLRFYEDLIF